MKELKYKGIIEGLLFASGDEGITIRQLANILHISSTTVEMVLMNLSKSYESEDRGIRMMQSNQVIHLTTKPEHSEYYQKLLEKPRTTRMSQATLETLAIIAYKQPITRVKIEEIRGVNSDSAVQTLLARSLIESVGRKETIGRPVLFGTTKEFLIYFGLASLDELPPLPENISATSIQQEVDLFLNHATFEEED